MRAQSPGEPAAQQAAEAAASRSAAEAEALRAQLRAKEGELAKAQAEAAVQRNYGGGSSLIIRPGVISGGGPGLPPPPGVPPVPVDAVARAAVAGALGKKSGILDGRDEIVRI